MENSDTENYDFDYYKNLKKNKSNIEINTDNINLIKNNNIDLQIENVLPDNKTLPDNSSKKIFASQH